MQEKRKNLQYAVIGLGQFGMSIAETLASHDVDVMVCDLDEHRVAEAAAFATHAVQADVSDESAIVNLGLGNFDIVVISMAEDFEATLMATMIAKEQGADYILVKARSARQKKILLNSGADHVVLPEHEMGARIARRLVGSNIRDILDDSEYYTISEMRPQADWIGKTIRQADIQRTHLITVLAVRHGETVQIPVSPDHVLERGDVLVIMQERKPTTQA